MICEIIKLCDATKSGNVPVLKTYLLDGPKKRGAVLICPGGGYGILSPREAEPIALKFNAAGYHACVLYYSIAPDKHPQPLLDASRAMAILRRNSEKWNVDAAKIAVCGFSAGGHLAASLGVHWNKPYLHVDGMEPGINRPDAMILCYPVLSSGEFGHRGTFANLLGSEAGEKELFEMSLEHQIDRSTPPAFIWHTCDDELVPVENSLLFSLKMREKGIPFELHIYSDGPHGLALATEETKEGSIGADPHVATWVSLCVEWLNKLFS